LALKNSGTTLEVRQRSVGQHCIIGQSMYVSNSHFGPRIPDQPPFYISVIAACYRVANDLQGATEQRRNIVFFAQLALQFIISPNDCPDGDPGTISESSYLPPIQWMECDRITN